MIRVILFAFAAAVVASFLSEGDGTVVAIVFFGVLALIVFSLVTGRTALRCPFCNKRVKLGATHCHHCGRVAVTHRPESSAPAAAYVDPITVPRECEHCKSIIRPDATVCAVCHRDINLWSLHEGAWWQRQADGTVLRLSPQTLRWEKAAETGATVT